MAKRACVKWDEYDAFTGWRRFIKWRAGERAEIKRRVNRRERRLAKADIRLSGDNTT